MSRLTSHQSIHLYFTLFLLPGGTISIVCLPAYYYSHLFTCPTHLHCLSSGVLLFSSLYVSKPYPLSIFRRIIILISLRVQTISIVYLPAYYYSHLFTCPNHLHCLSSGVLLFSPLHVSNPSPLSIFRRIIILISLRVQTISIVYLPAYYYSHLFACPNHIHCLSSGVLLFSSLCVSKPSPLSVFRRIIILISLRVQTISIVYLPAYYYSHLFTCPNHLHCLSSGVLLFSPLHVSKPSPLSIFRRIIILTSSRVQTISIVYLPAYYYSHLFTCPNHLHCLSSGVLLFSSLYVSKPYPLSIFRRAIILISLRVQTVSIVYLPAYYYSHLFKCPNHLHCLSSGVLLFSLSSLRVQTISIVYLPAYYYSHLFTCPNHLHCLSSGVLLFSPLYVSKPYPLSIFRRIIILTSSRVQTISIVYLPAYYYSHLFTCPNHLHCLSSGVLLFSSLCVSKPSLSRFPAPLCDVLFLQSLHYVIITHVISQCLSYLHSFASVPSSFFIWELAIGTVSISYNIAG